MGFFDEGLFGALLGSEEVYGKKPKPVIPPTPTEIFQQYMDANLAVQPKLGEFQSGQQDQLLAMLEKAAPGSTAAQAKYQQNIDAGLRGEIPDDVLSQIQRGGAAWGITSGTGGATGDSIAGARSLRNLGLTSLQRQDRAGQQLEQLLNTTRRVATPPLFQPIVPQVNPYARYEADIYNANLAAAPDPGIAGGAAAQQGLLNSILAAYGGGAASPSVLQSNARFGGGTIPNYGGMPSAGQYGNMMGDYYGGSNMGANYGSIDPGGELLF